MNTVALILLFAMLISAIAGTAVLGARERRRAVLRSRMRTVLNDLKEQTRRTK